MRGKLKTEQNCNILTPHSYGHNSISYPFSWLLNRGPAGPAPWNMVLIPASSLQLVWSPTDWTSCAPRYIIIWRPLFFLRASQFRIQFNPSTVKVISWYSSTGCTCYLHRCISYFDSWLGSIGYKGSLALLWQEVLETENSECKPAAVCLMVVLVWHSVSGGKNIYTLFFLSYTHNTRGKSMVYMH